MRHLCAAGLALAFVLGPQSVRAADPDDLPPLEPPGGAQAASPFAVREQPAAAAAPAVSQPASQPDEAVGPPPGPGAFYVAGGYVPEGRRVVWKPGYWARVRPGWEWIPSRWVRRSEGWTFRQGTWVHALADRDVTPASAEAPIPVGPQGRPELQSEPADRHVVARPKAEPDDEAPLDEPALERNGTAPAVPGRGLEPIPEPPAPGNGAATAPLAPPPGDVPPPVLVPSAPYAARRLPIPFWDGATLVVPPTRFSAGVVVPTAPRQLGNGVLYPPVGIMPPVRDRDDAPLARRARGGRYPGRLRDFLDQVLP